jgi:hypothetical protein
MDLSSVIRQACLRIRHKHLRPVPPWQLQHLGRPVWRIRHTTPDGPPWLADLGLRRWYTYLVYPQHDPPPSLTRDREGPEALPGTLPESRIATGGLLHRHACLRRDE